MIKGASATSKAAGAATTAARACSFTGATVVLMASGELKPIASVVVGDLVVASDPETGEQAAKPVEHVFVHEDVVFDLVIGDEVISTTEDHPFWSVTDNRFERADQLQPGELVLSAAGTVLQVSRVVSGLGRAEVIHTFHVGASQALVHNTCGPPFAMGIGDHLDEFASAHGATTWKDLPSAVDWKSGVQQMLNDPGHRVLFNLDGVDVMPGVLRAASGRGGATDWELLQLRNGSFPNVEFWSGGQQVSSPFG